VVLLVGGVTAPSLLPGAGLAAENRPAPADSSDATDKKKLTELLEKHRDALREEIQARRKEMYYWDSRIVDAAWLLLQTELALTDKADDRVALYRKHDEFLVELQKLKADLDSRIKNEYPRPDLKAERLRAEVAMLRERAGPKQSKEQAAELQKRLIEWRDELRTQRKAHLDWISHLRAIPNLGPQTKTDGCPDDLRRRLLEVELELAVKPRDRQALLQTYCDEIKANFNQLTRSDKFDAFPKPDTHPTFWYAMLEAQRWDAEIVLERARLQGNAPTAEEAKQLIELSKKRRAADQEALEARLEIVKKLCWKQCVERVLDSYASRLRDDLEDDPSDPFAAWRTYQAGLKDLQEIADKNNGLDSSAKAMLKAARLQADIAWLRWIAEKKVKKD
jgi:hypothetical protein